MNSNSKEPSPLGLAGHHHHHHHSRAMRRNSHLAPSGSAVPPGELSSAISFLGEAALAASDLLLAQSEELFYGSVREDPKGDNENISSGQKRAGNIELDAAKDQEQTVDPKSKKQKQASESVAETQNHNNQRTTCAHKFSLLYQKCKHAHDMILKAEELGSLHDFPHPRSGHPSPLVKQQRQGSSGGIASVMPPPNLSGRVGGGPSGTPSLLRSRGSFGSTGGAPAGAGAGPPGGKNPSLLRRNAPGAEATHRRSVAGAGMLHRSISGMSVDGRAGTKGGGGAGGREKADPPPEVLDFLKALNSSKPGNSPVGANLEAIGNRAHPDGAGSISISKDGTITPHKRRSIPPPPPPSSQKQKFPVPPLPTHPPPPGKKEKSPDSIIAPPSYSMKLLPPRSQAVATTTATEDVTPSKPPEGQRMTRSRRSAPGRASLSQEKVYGVGESVRAKIGGIYRGGIVKNVDYGSGDDDDVEEASRKKVMYEVEFSDGEIWDVEPKDMSNDDGG